MSRQPRWYRWKGEVGQTFGRSAKAQVPLNTCKQPANKKEMAEGRPWQRLVPPRSRSSPPPPVPPSAKISGEEIYRSGEFWDRAGVGEGPTGGGAQAPVAAVPSPPFPLQTHTGGPGGGRAQAPPFLPSVPGADPRRRCRLR